MGSIVAVIGGHEKALLGERLAAMLQRSPYRGAAQTRLVADGLAVAVQSMDGDASMEELEYVRVAFHGYIVPE